MAERVAMKIRDLPKLILDKLYSYEYKHAVADKENYRDLCDELARVGYEYVEQEVQPGDYNDLRGYLDCKILIVETK